MSKTMIRLCLLLLGLSFCSCAGKEEPAPSSHQKEDQEAKPAIPQADPPKVELVGKPSGSGYTSESIRVQIGPDESLRELHTPAAGMQFLLVRLSIDGAKVLVPQDYRLVIHDKQYTPHAIGFGRPNGVYSSVESYVGDRVELALGAADQLLHDGERIQKSELKNPLVFLVYEVPQAPNPTLWHGTQPFPLSPDYQSLAQDLSGAGGTLTANAGLNLVDPNAASEKFFAQLLGTTRTRLELNGTPTDVLALTVGLSALKATTIELKKADILLQSSGGAAKGGTIYFHFNTDAATLTAGSSFSEGESYEGRDLIALDTGGFRLPLSPDKSVTATLIFPNPKLAGDMELQLSSSVAVRVPEPVNPLGKFPPPVEKMPDMVAWASLIGTPIDAGYLSDSASIAADANQLSSPMPSEPGDGLRYLMVRFRVEQESQFVPIDYRIAEQESHTIYRPLAAAFGDSPIYVKGLGYEKLALKFGNATEPLRQGGQLTGWTLKTPEVTLLYEVSPAREFVFIHGDTQFVIEP